MNVRKTEITTTESINEFLMVQAQHMEHGRVEIMKMNLTFDSLITQIIGHPMRQTTATSTTCKPGGIPRGVMITPQRTLKSLQTERADSLDKTMVAVRTARIGNWWWDVAAPQKQTKATSRQTRANRMERSDRDERARSGK